MSARWLSHRPKTGDSSLLSPAEITSSPSTSNHQHKVSFSDSLRSASVLRSVSTRQESERAPSSRVPSRPSSRPQSPAGLTPKKHHTPIFGHSYSHGNAQGHAHGAGMIGSTSLQNHMIPERRESRNLQRINRQSEALSQQVVVAPTAAQPKPFLIYHDNFLSLLGANPTLQLLIDDPRAPYFHEAGVFHPPTNTLFITSNQLEDNSPDAVTTRQKTIVITKIEFFSPTDFTRDKVRCPERNYMAMGGTNYRDGLILCAQGSLREPSGLIYMEAKRPHKTTALLNNYHSRPFNSPSDVVVHSDGSIWFTDPIYGHEQGFRPRPVLPQFVYRFDPVTGDIRVVADGFGRPKGLCFNPDETVLYITDSDLIHGDGGTDYRRAATIYAYTVIWESVSPFLANRRVFAYADTGAPNGVKCDVFGNVYSGCGDGINIWSAGGMLIGKIQIDGGCANFCFGRNGEMWCFGENKLWRVQLGPETRGALLGI